MTSSPWSPSRSRPATTQLGREHPRTHRDSALRRGARPHAVLRHALDRRRDHRRLRLASPSAAALAAPAAPRRPSSRSSTTSRRRSPRMPTRSAPRCSAARRATRSSSAGCGSRRPSSRPGSVEILPTRRPSSQCGCSPVITSIRSRSIVSPRSTEKPASRPSDGRGPTPGGDRRARRRPRRAPLSRDPRRWRRA